MISDCVSPLAEIAEKPNLYVARAAKNLAALGFEIDVFTRRESAEQPEILDWLKGVRVINIAAGPSCQLSEEDSLKLLPQFTSHALRFFKQQNYDLIHANFYSSGLAALNLKRATETPFVITFHELGRAVRIHQTGADDFADIRCEIEDRIVRNADFIFAQSIQEERDLMYLYDAPTEKIKIVSPESANEIADIYEKVCQRHDSFDRFATPYLVTGSLTGFNTRISA